MKECIEGAFSLNGISGKSHIEIPKVIGTDHKKLPILLSQRNRELVKSMIEEEGVSLYRLERQTGSSTSALISSYLFARYLSTNVLYLSRNNYCTVGSFEHFRELKSSFIPIVANKFLKISKEESRVDIKPLGHNKIDEECSILFMDFDEFVPILLSKKMPPFEKWKFNPNKNLAIIIDNVSEALAPWDKGFWDKKSFVFPSKTTEFSKRWIIIETSDVR